MSRVVLLDGGMGQELVRRSSRPPSPLWSAQIMLDEPQIVEAVHRDYIEAGARVLTLNSYSATPERLARDADRDLFEPLQRAAIEIAIRAIGDNDIVIAGCLPPLYGSYHPETAPSFEVCLATYREIVRLQEQAVEVFICETLSSLKEIRSAVQAAAESGKPVWCAMSVMDEDGGTLRSGEPLLEGARAARDAGAAAVLINCSWPEAIKQGLSDLDSSGLPFGGFANGFKKIDDLALGGTVDVLETRADLGPDRYAGHAMAWVDAGARIVGGCCEIGPAHISALAQRLKQAGHQIVGML